MWKTKNVFTLGPMAQAPLVYLWNKVIFVSFVELKSPKPWCFISGSRHVWKALDEQGVHTLGLRLFGATVWKLLIIEPFSQWKLNKIKTETVLKFGGILGVVGKPLASQIFKKLSHNFHS
jgi:hypothetical protein